MTDNTGNFPHLSPTGELHRDPIEPWQAEQWAKELGIPEQQVRQLSVEVGPDLVRIREAWSAKVSEHVTSDEIRKAQRDGRLAPESPPATE